MAKSSDPSLTFSNVAESTRQKPLVKIGDNVFDANAIISAAQQARDLPTGDTWSRTVAVVADDAAAAAPADPNAAAGLKNPAS